MRRVLVVAQLLVVTATSSPVFAAEELDDANKAAVRSLGYEGVDLYQRGDFREASERLERAFEVSRAPSLGLWSARALEKLGRLVEASERYLAVTQLEVGAGEKVVQKQAQDDAATERQALLPRIPRLVLKVEGVERSSIQCSVDGKSVPSALVGVSRPIDPGTHQIEVRSGAETKTDSVTLAEGETREVDVLFAAPPSAPKAQPHAPTEAVPIAHTPPPVATPRASSTQRTLGYVAVGVGGAALLSGGVATLLALNKRSALAAQCPNDNCLPAAHDGADTYNSLRTFSTIGVLGGAVLGGAGVVLLVTSPRTAEAQVNRRRIDAWLGLGSAGVSGSF